jgi:hypothetical protein
MKSTIRIALVLLTLASCNATRPPIDEDAIDGDAVQRHGYRPSGPPNAPAVWEDSIDGDAVQRRNYKPSGPPNPPAVWEDSIDAGHDRPMRAAANDRTAQRFAETRGELASGGN